MTTAATLVAYCWNITAKAWNQERIDWLVAQRDLCIQQSFGGGGAVKSLINAAGNGSTAGFQIDLAGPEKLQVITDALVNMGVIPPVAAPVTTSHAAFACLER